MQPFLTQPERADRTDGLVDTNRALTPPAVTDERATKRLSISELNAMDMDSLREKFLTTKRDDRGPIQRFFDVLDLPRNGLYNLIGSVVAPEALARKREAGETGTFGLADVHFGDVLDGLGVTNHVIRGAVGFLGDLATDPLFYAGGAGGIARMFGSSGRAVEAAASGTRAIRQADEAVAAGGKIADAATERLVHSVGITPQWVAAERAAGRNVAGEVQRRLLGDVETIPGVPELVGQGPAESIARGLSRVGGTYRTKGGAIAEYLGQEGLQGQEADIAEAVKNWIATHGRAAAPGVRIGINKTTGKLGVEIAGRGPSRLRVGSQVAHVPFTDYALQVSPLTARGIRSAGDIALATGGIGEAGRVANARVLGAEALRTRYDQLGTDKEALDANFVRDDALHREGIAEADRLASVDIPEVWKPIADQRRAEHVAFTQRYKDAYQAIADEAGQLNARIEQLPAQLPTATAKPNDVLAMSRNIDAAKAKASLLESKAEAVDIPGRRSAAITELEAGLDKMTPAEADAERAQRYNQLSPDQKALVDMTAAEAERARFDADLYSKRATAWKEYADSMTGSIRENMKGWDGDALEVAKRAMGEDSDIVGAAGLMPLRVAADKLKIPNDHWTRQFMDAYDRLKKDVFGERVGETARQARMFKHSPTVQAEAAMHALDGYKKAVVDALDAAGQDPAVTLDKAMHILTLLATDKANKAGLVNDVFWTTKRGQPGVLNDWVRELQDARNSGLLKDPKLAASLKGISDTYHPLMQYAGDIEKQDQVLRETIPGYINIVPTAEAESAIQGIKAHPLATMPEYLRRGSGVATERFNKSRSMMEYRFPSARFGGQERWFLEHNIAMLDSLTAEEKALLLKDQSAAAKPYQEMLADIDEWRNMKNRPAPRQMDPVSMNELYSEFPEKLAMLTGGAKLPGGFADSNLATMTAARMAQHERAVGRQSFARYLASKLVTLDRGQQANFHEGGVITFPGGFKANVRSVLGPDGKAVLGVDVNGQFYRPLARSVREDRANIVMQAMGLDKSDNLGVLAHDSVARQIEAAVNLTQDDASQRALLRLYDQMTAHWKGLTLFHPSWLIQNIVGDTFNHLMNGARVQDYAKYARFATRVLLNAHDPAALKNLSVTVNGRTMTGLQVLEAATRERILGTNFWNANMVPHAAAGLTTMPSAVEGSGLVKSVMNPKQALKLAQDDVRAKLDALSITRGGKVNGVDRAAAVGGVMSDRAAQWLYRPWMKLNGKVSDSGRLTSFLSHMEQGSDAAGAAQKVVEAGFDYGDLTRIERGFFRRMFPFYAWIRNNMAYQMHMLVQRPSYAASFPRLRDALEEMVYGNAKVPMNQRPGWLNEQLALQVGEDPNSRSALLLNSLLPLQEGYTVGAAALGPEGIQNLLHYFGSGLNPIVRSPVEIAAGREIFSGKSIGADPLLSDIGPGAYASGLLRPVREAQQVVRSAREQGPAAAVARSIVGGRVQSFTDTRNAMSKASSYRDEEQKLQLAVRRAEYAGDKARSVTARARLLALYSDMQRNGEKIPRWAEGTLSQFAGSP